MNGFKRIKKRRRDDLPIEMTQENVQKLVDGFFNNLPSEWKGIDFFELLIAESKYNIEKIKLDKKAKELSNALQEKIEDWYKDSSGPVKALVRSSFKKVIVLNNRAKVKNNDSDQEIYVLFSSKVFQDIQIYVDNKTKWYEVTFCGKLFSPTQISQPNEFCFFEVPASNPTVFIEFLTIVLSHVSEETWLRERLISDLKENWNLEEVSD